MRISLARTTPPTPSRHRTASCGGARSAREFESLASSNSPPIAVVSMRFPEASMSSPSTADAGAEARADHWSKIARLWHYVGPPLRPPAGAMALYREAIDVWQQRQRRAPRVLLLGVTPELRSLPWPAETAVQAAD